MYPEIDRLVAELVARKKYIYLCTNAILLKEKLEPVHAVEVPVVQRAHGRPPRGARRGGVPRRRLRPGGARASARRSRRGFRVTTNTTLFDGASPLRMRAVLRRDDGPRRRGHDGLPGLQLLEGARPGALPAPRSRTHELFTRDARRIRRSAGSSTSRRSSSRFLMGKHDYECTPWGNPTYNMFGWQQPCYLLQEGYAATFKELMETTRLGGLRAQERQREVPATAWCTAATSPPPSNHTFSSAARLRGDGRWSRSPGALARAGAMTPRGLGARDRTVPHARRRSSSTPSTTGATPRSCGRRHRDGRLPLQPRPRGAPSRSSSSSTSDGERSVHAAATPRSPASSSPARTPRRAIAGRPGSSARSARRPARAPRPARRRVRPTPDPHRGRARGAGPRPRARAARRCPVAAPFPPSARGGRSGSRRRPARGPPRRALAALLAGLADPLVISAGVCGGLAPALAPGRSRRARERARSRRRALPMSRRRAPRGRGAAPPAATGTLVTVARGGRDAGGQGRALVRAPARSRWTWSPP